MEVAKGRVQLVALHEILKKVESHVGIRQSMFARKIYVNQRGFDEKSSSRMGRGYRLRDVVWMW